MVDKVEAYHRFAGWLFLGGEGVIADNDSEEQEKLIKYNDLVANTVIFQNVVDVSRVLREVLAEGYSVKREDVAALSPFERGEPTTPHQQPLDVSFGFK